MLKKVKNMTVTSKSSAAELLKAADELLKQKPARAKVAKVAKTLDAAAEGDAAEAPKKRAATKTAAAKTPAKTAAKAPAKAAAKKAPGRKR